MLDRVFRWTQSAQSYRPWALIFLIAEVYHRWVDQNSKFLVII